MSTAYVEPVRNCHNCGAPLPLGILACPQCHSLVHSEDLVRISTRAKALEEQDEIPQAREEWLKALPLLPPESTQAAWVNDKVRQLKLAASSAAPPAQKHAWASKLGPLAPIAILLAKSKTLLLAVFKLKFIFSLFLFMGVYWSLFGWAFGSGFAVLILVHEMGHYVDIRRRGLPADMPVSFPALAPTSVGLLSGSRAKRVRPSVLLALSQDSSVPLFVPRFGTARTTACGQPLRAPPPD